LSGYFKKRGYEDSAALGANKISGCRKARRSNRLLIQRSSSSMNVIPPS
jgi:hypothetical protein